ncbi:MAG: hypothetical protein QXQ60_06390 [Thermofilum sp.]
MRASSADGEGKIALKAKIYLGKRTVGPVIAAVGLRTLYMRAAPSTAF